MPWTTNPASVRQSAQSASQRRAAALHSSTRAAAPALRHAASNIRTELDPAVSIGAGPATAAGTTPGIPSNSAFSPTGLA